MSNMEIEKTTYTFLELSNCKYGDKEFELEFIVDGDKFIGGLMSCINNKRIIFTIEHNKKQVEVVNFGDGKLWSSKYIGGKYNCIEISDKFEVYRPNQC
jgi:hypothetical protein